MTITKVAPFYQGHGVDAFVTLIWYHPYTPQPIKTGKPAIGVSDRSLVNALLRQTPDSVVDWVQIRTVRRCLLLLDNLLCPVCGRSGALSCCNTDTSPAMRRMTCQRLLLQHHFTVIPAVHFHAMFNKKQLWTAQLWVGNWNHQRLGKVVDNAEAIQQQFRISWHCAGHTLARSAYRLANRHAG